MKKRKGLYPKTAAVLTGAMLLASVSSAAFAQDLSAAETETEPMKVSSGVDLGSVETEADQSNASYTSQNLTFYLGDLEASKEYPVYFINDVMDLPYMNLADFADVMFQVAPDAKNIYGLNLETDGSVALLTRENGFSMMVDFDADTILFDDYDEFVHGVNNYCLLDIVSDNFTDDEGTSVLIDRVSEGSYDRYGKSIELDLYEYDIHLYCSPEDGLYLLPMQTMSDFLLSVPNGYCLLFNKKAVYYANGGRMVTEDGEPTPMLKAFYDVPSENLSNELAWFSYCELCMALDNLYGLKEIHDITTFDQLFSDTGYKDALLSTDPNVKDGALSDFINYYLDDLHSDFKVASYLTDEAQSSSLESLSTLRSDAAGERFSDARIEADHEILSYEEVGDTAYVTFDHFIMPGEGSTYVNGEIQYDEDPETTDTAALVIYAHQQITRKDSPIKNVVIDLSLNGGGDVDAAAFVCAWYLGEACLSVRSSLTGAISTGTYRIDTNLDGSFDEEDTLHDKNLFCLIGPYSFSCGNLVPNVFKSSGIVTLLGQQSGGGSCSVMQLSTAYSSLFQMSSPKHMSYIKNGSAYDTDTGIQPDCTIVKPSNFYDRKALTDYIHQLF